MTRSRILLTGAAGFLGSHLVDRLLAAGHDVVGVDNLSMGKLENVASHLNGEAFRFVQRDITEPLAFAYQESFGLPVTVLRFFGSYGPRQHLSWWGGPQSVFIDAVLNDREIPIHGDGLQTRSFTYVSDTVEGIYAAIVTAEANGEIFNIGSAHEVTILDLARIIKRVCDTPGELKLRFVPYESFTGKSYEDVRRRVP